MAEQSPQSPQERPDPVEVLRFIAGYVVNMGAADWRAAFPEWAADLERFRDAAHIQEHDGEVLRFIGLLAHRSLEGEAS